ncbi:hypothetical protein HPB51_021092 [Rhipicephalus microplus]|uniref:Protein kinase domain-containing protein n=1 Tax=Rhipicephalus microplus TaxID=6941 RepID=A0A9J6DC68_RHIMP|nr:hypothetical protein HPB51_021092 [Rhipicephalus microplus]
MSRQSARSAFASCQPYRHCPNDPRRTLHPASYKSLQIRTYHRLLLASDRVPGMMNDYVIIEKTGEGAYGAVYKAKYKATKKIVAIKKSWVEDGDEGIPVTTI